MMNSLTTTLPTCPRCNNDNTYDIIPELSNLVKAPPKLSNSVTAYSMNNKNYYCIDCHYSWKKYSGRKPYEAVQSIYAETGGFPGPFFKMKINLETKTAVSNALIKYRFDKEAVFSRLSQIDIDWFRKELYECDFLNWADRYEDLTILDGVHWSVRIDYDTYTEQKNGSGHFPPGWTKFCQALTKVGGKEFY